MAEPPPWFVAQLRHTVTWCAPRVDVDAPMECLRSDELAPPSQSDPQRAQTATVASACFGFGVDWLESSMISAVCAKRQALVGEPSEPVSALDLCGGRLLLSAYDYTHHDGATEHATDGYLDALDIPPWDTWVGEVTGTGGGWSPTIISHVFGGKPNRGILVAWVPPQFVPRVELALDEECMGMLCWADDPTARGPGRLTFADMVPAWLADLA